MSQAKVLADRIYPAEGFATDALRIATANVLLALCAHVAFALPWTPVPITGQTFGVLLVGVLLGSRRGALALLLYLLEGAAGLPVFQPLGLPGPARFFGPTAGYLLAYPAAAFATGWIVERFADTAREARAATMRFADIRLLGALLTGEAIIFACGCAWLALWMGFGWSNAWREGALPFLPGEVVKMALIVAAVSGYEYGRRKFQN